MKATSEYFCSDSSRLDKEECVTLMELDVVVEQIENRYIIREEFNAAQDMEMQKNICVNDLEGEVKTLDSGVVYCEYSTSVMEEGNVICLDDSYTLKDGKCIKEIRLPAKVRYVCPEGYFLDGIYCKEK